MTEQKRLAESLRAQLARLADPAKTVGALRYLPPDQQQQIRLYGVGAVQVRAMAREAYAEVRAWPLAQRNQLCLELWSSGMAEEGTLAIELYRRFARQCGPCEFRLFEKWIERYVHNWAHCDGISMYLMRAVFAKHPELAAELPAWTASGNRWKRRAAAASLVHEVRAHRQLDVAFEVCHRLRADEDDMVCKGIGWLLKNAYLRNPKPTMAFLLNGQQPEFARGVLRYAAEKMTAADRRRVLG